MTSTPPQPIEHADYHLNYISLVPPGEICQTLESQVTSMLPLLARAEPKADYCYAEDKWSVKETVGHIIETERVMAYRALTISRGDETPLPGFDQDLFILNSPWCRTAWKDVVGEYETVRRSTIFLTRNFTEADWSRWGTSSGKPITVRALGWIIAGHELYHRKLLAEKYGIA